MLKRRKVRCLTQGTTAVFLDLLYTNYSPWTSSVNITGSLLEIQILSPHPRLSESGSLGIGPAFCVFK